MKWLKRLNTKELNKFTSPEATVERKRREKRRTKRMAKVPLHFTRVEGTRMTPSRV